MSVASPAPHLLPRTAERLFDQQMWCWGCDVRHAAGNLLLAHGFSKQPSPHAKLPSAYHLTLTEAIRLTLWGWGLWLSMPEGSVYVRRAGLRVRLCAACQPQAWCEGELPITYAITTPAHHAQAAHALAHFTRWAAGYEAWLAAYTAPDYRAAALASWPQARRYGGVSSTDLHGDWLALAADLSQ